MTQRIIKFRAWDYDEEIMRKNWTQIDITPADRLILMQYTGLKDKNGTEIYEGDIVKGIMKFPQLLTGDTDENSNFKMAGEVFYDHSGFSLKCIQSMCDPEREGMVKYFDFIGGYDGDFDEMEIIGNIYENPEILSTNT